MQNVIKLIDFSSDPWGRDASENPESNGEMFRKQYLVDAFKTQDSVVVDFSDLDLIVDSSFIGSAFIGLVKKEGFHYDEILSKLHILPEDSIYPHMINTMFSIEKQKDGLK
ncbi:STAS-like domain-containing protein [Pasteurella sp. PK-2025]|uniref:STAS-like domain-containing protein n=1 Tax=Pasteurella sp. PK-2025 TaxID=3413133 RepID=UPI003C74EAB9